MDWQDNEFENFLKKFRLREPKDLPIAKSVSGVRSSRVKIAAAAALILAVGASAAIVRQLVAKKETPSAVQTSVQSPAQGVEKQTEVPREEASAPKTSVSAAIPPVPEFPTSPVASPVKIDPKPPEPLKQLKVVVPALEPAPAAQDAGPQSSDEDKLGREAFNKACGLCHALEAVNSTPLNSAQEYSALVNRMVGYGAPVPPPEVPAVVDYLFRTYGRGDPGKATLNSACTTCHALDVLDNHKDTDKAGFRSIIDRMNAYGAGIKPEQIDPLAEFLLRTYSRRQKN